MLDDARPELGDGPALAPLLVGACASRSVADGAEGAPSSEVRPATRPAAAPAPVGAAASSPVKKYFEIDGVLYELRPVRAKVPTGKPRGLAAVSPERRAEIAARGGRATARSAKAVRPFEDVEAAKEAGRKGGLAKARNARDLSAAAE